MSKKLSLNVHPVAKPLYLSVQVFMEINAPKKTFIIILKLTFLVLMALIFFEGIASTISATLNIHSQFRSVKVAEMAHTRFDPVLGWISIPNVDIKDLYGKNISLSTNNRGFRGNRDTFKLVETGKKRVICSGDSFTLGYGVKDDETWCFLLELLNEDVESVNVGQGGYGIDQAYLWYKKDASDLDRSLHVFALIGYDFLRTQKDHFRGVEKPTLAIKDGNLVFTNNTLKEKNYFVRLLHQNGYLLQNFNMIRLLQGKLDSFLATDSTLTIKKSTLDVAMQIFMELNAENETRQSSFLVVFLPTPLDIFPNTFDTAREESKKILEHSNIAYLDLVEKLRQLDFDKSTRLFFEPNHFSYPHLNTEGNQWVADIISEQLPDLLEVNGN